MPSLTYVEITGTFTGGDEQPLSGTVTFTASQAVYAAGLPVVTPDVPVAGQITDGHLLSESGGALQLLATDNAGLTFLTLSGFFYWTVQVTVGGLTEPAWSFGLPSSPATVDLFALANMPYSSGGGAVASVFTRTGAVTAQSGDYSVGQVTGAAPLASPALTGTPTAPTQSAGTNSTRVATTAYADAAVAVETARAGTAEALLAPKASPALTGNPTAPTQTTGDSSTKIATDAFVATAVAVETSRATTAEGIISAAVSTETSRAMSAEALLVPLSDLPLSLANGGTGHTSQQTALDALAGAVTSAQFLRGNGTHVVLAPISAGDVPVLNQSTSGSAASCTGNAATATNLAGGATVPAYIAPHVTALTDASSTLIDASLGNVFDWPLGAGSHTLAAPSNPVNGQMIKIRIAYSGSFTPLFNAIYHFGTDGQPAWTATNAKVDEVAFEYNSGVSAWCCQGWKLGF